MVLRVPHYGDPATVAKDGCPLGHRRQRVVASLGVDMRRQGAQDTVCSRFVKNEDGVDTRKRGDELRPLPLGKQRTIGSLGLADRAVPVDCDHQVVAKRTGLAERADMAHVKKIEGSIGENDSLSFALQLLDSFFRLLEVRQDLPGNSVPFARPGFFCWHDAASLPSPPILATQKPPFLLPDISIS